MKSLTLRASLALACALSLAGCGGGGGSLQLAGSVFGLTRDGLVLKNGSELLSVPNGSVAFAFVGLLSNDQGYAVTVDTQPDSAVCTVTAGTGITSTLSISSVIVSCVTDSYDIGGQVSGLNGATGLVLNNGQDRQEIKADGHFTMTLFATDGTTYASGRVPVGSPYGVTVLTQPQGKTCTVANGVNIMTSAAKTIPVDNIAVTCV
ncbi:MAG: putative 6-phosphogluconolactonase domain protein [Massilia sp.]|nr:putative 6-phosphogluconolactonase domain protein [Massilia sp.]